MTNQSRDFKELGGIEGLKFGGFIYGLWGIDPGKLLTFFCGACGFMDSAMPDVFAYM